MSEHVPKRLVRQVLESLARAGVTDMGKLPPPLPRGKAPAAAARPAATHEVRTTPPVPRPSGKGGFAEPPPPRPARTAQGGTAATPAGKAPPSGVKHQLLPGSGGPAGSGELGPVLAAERRPAALEIIRQEVAACTRCPELACTRTQTVFGVGNPSTRICFVGEAPGADEDRLGEPFVGRAGQLLTRIIEACRLTRGDVYILNVLKCRPPENRTPVATEVQNCRGYLERQLELIRPEMICCLGTVASQCLLETTMAIGRLRNKVHQWRGIPLICTYHPSYLLRNPPAKRDVWDDMKFMFRELGQELQ